MNMNLSTDRAGRVSTDVAQSLSARGLAGKVLVIGLGQGEIGPPLEPLVIY